MTLTARCVLVVGFALAMGLSGCAPPPAAEPVGDREGSRAGERPLDSIALIDNAVRAGALDYSTGMLYKVYVMFEPSSLPKEYQSDVPSKCGTPLIQEVQRNWSALSPSHRQEISQYIQPPTEMGSTATQLDDVTPDRLRNEREKLD